MRENAGALVPNTIKRAATAGAAAASQAKAGYDDVRGNGTTAGAPTPGLQAGARAAGGAAGTAANWVLGKTSEKFESGGNGAGAVSTGKGDRGGASYGTYQLASKTGTLDKFLQESGYAAQFQGLVPASPEFNAKWKQIAKNDPSFGGAQHDFMRATHFEPAMKALKDAGIDLTNHGPAVQDALWSTATQFGPGSAKKGDGAFGIFSKSLAGKDVASLSQADIVTAVQNYKAANNDLLFKSSSAAVRAGTLSRATSEKSALLRLSSAGTAPVASASTVMTGMPTVTVPSSVPSKIPDAPSTPEIAQRLGSGGGRQPVVIRVSEPVGQNVADRGFAQIASGGIGISGH